MKNSKFTKEFRDSTVQLVMNSEESVLKIAKDLDVNPKTIYNWIREYKKANNIPTDAQGKGSSVRIHNKEIDRICLFSIIKCKYI